LAAVSLGKTIKFSNSANITGNKVHILFYEICGMGYGGTSKEIQILAKYLDKSKYKVSFFYSHKPRWVDGVNLKRIDSRLKYMEDTDVNLINFDYISQDKRYPYVIRGMKPDIFDFIENEKVDLLITPTAGETYFPINMIRNIPIILLNVFGAYTVQPNIVCNIPYTNELTRKMSSVVDESIIREYYIPSEGPVEGSVLEGKSIREKFGIKDSDFVFGRIGRNIDEIFDPIGLRAFKKVVSKNTSAHYIIMAPPPICEKIVLQENIPNVHFLPPSGDELKIWGFFQSLDALAHFRRDGETFGLNIAEAMLCGKPIISHRSIVWNGHLEYLDNSFSRVTEIDDFEQYSKYMEEFIELKNNNKFDSLCKSAKKKAEKEFHIRNQIKKFEDIIDEHLRRGSE
jgi:glycosyltransferase involved in cell wall biosynthesis